jgi:transposase
LKTLFADSGYQGPKFAKALAKVLPHLDIEIVKRSDRVSEFEVLPKRWIVERTNRTFGFTALQERSALGPSAALGGPLAPAPGYGCAKGEAKQKSDGHGGDEGNDYEGHVTFVHCRRTRCGRICSRMARAFSGQRTSRQEPRGRFGFLTRHTSPISCAIFRAKFCMRGSQVGVPG